MNQATKQKIEQSVAASAALKYGLKESKPMASTTVVGKPTAATAAAEEKQEAPKGERKTVTNWHALFEAALTPTYIRCDSWGPYNAGCHTALQGDSHIGPSQMKTHLEGEHGGGYFVSFKENYRNNPDSNIVRQGKPWDGWLQMEELGLELKDFRCDVCNEQVHLNVRNIHRHCKPHTGKSTRLKPGGDFWFTLSFDSPLESEEDDK